MACTSEAWWKYASYHPEKTRKYKQRSIRKDQFLYEKSTNSYRCPQGKKLNFIKEQSRESVNGYAAKVKVYSATPEDCSGCSLKSYCTKGKARSINISENYERLKQKARDQLASSEGRSLNKRRGFEVETVFGHRKQNAYYRRYYLRGIDKVQIEAGLFYTSYNLSKMYRRVMRDLSSYLQGFEGLPPGKLPPLGNSFGTLNRLLGS